tara:strand:+ start:4678 stop:5430 length:753 start_codon:yes stop_codon:yes gene_type:complete
MAMSNRANNSLKPYKGNTIPISQLKKAAAPYVGTFQRDAFESEAKQFYGDQADIATYFSKRTNKDIGFDSQGRYALEAGKPLGGNAKGPFGSKPKTKTPLDFQGNIDFSAFKPEQLANAPSLGSDINAYISNYASLEATRPLTLQESRTRDTLISLNTGGANGASQILGMSAQSTASIEAENKARQLELTARNKADTERSSGNYALIQRSIDKNRTRVQERQSRSKTSVVNTGYNNTGIGIPTTRSGTGT